MPSPLHELNRLIRDNRVDEFPTPNRALGMRPVEFAPGASVWLWETQPQTALNPFGTIAGGFLAVFIDQILSTAVAPVLEEDEWAVTAELKTSYIRALAPQRIEGRGRVIRRTRGAVFMEAEVFNAAGELSVAASSTWIVSRTNEGNRR